MFLGLRKVSIREWRVGRGTRSLSNFREGLDIFGRWGGVGLGTMAFGRAYAKTLPKECSILWL